jgi:hypothetical protein
MTVFKRESAAFGFSGSDRVTAVGYILIERELISCNQRLWIIIFVSFYKGHRSNSGAFYSTTLHALCKTAMT